MYYKKESILGAGVTKDGGFYVYWSTLSAVLVCMFVILAYIYVSSGWLCECEGGTLTTSLSKYIDPQAPDLKDTVL